MKGRPRDKVFEIANVVLVVLNLSAILSFFYLRWTQEGSGFHSEKVVVLSGCIVLFLGFILSHLRANFRPALFLINLSFLGIISLLVVMEFFFHIFPGSLPGTVVQVIPELDPSLKAVRGEVLEYMNESPWVKFQPNIVARSIGYRGAHFSYTWPTDPLGFKNTSEVFESSEIFAVALGDSFVEAMGVPIEKTWCSLVSKHGFSIYNLGVQGYSPQQMVGVLRLYGKRFKPKFVVWGFTPGIENRAEHFANPESVFKDKKFTGGIDSINNYMQERRAQPAGTWIVLNGFLDLLKFNVSTLSSRVKSAYPLYYSEVQSGSQIKFDPESIKWRLTTNAILDAKKISEDIGAKMVILLFHHRQFIYYNDILHEEPPAGHYEVRLTRELIRFAAENDIEVIDSYSALRTYLADLSGGLDSPELPYFKTDGHMNEIGQAIIANIVRDFLKKVVPFKSRKQAGVIRP